MMVEMVLNQLLLFAVSGTGALLSLCSIFIRVQIESNVVVVTERPHGSGRFVLAAPLGWFYSVLAVGLASMAVFSQGATVFVNVALGAYALLFAGVAAVQFKRCCSRQTAKNARQGPDVQGVAIGVEVREQKRSVLAWVKIVMLLVFHMVGLQVAIHGG